MSVQPYVPLPLSFYPVLAKKRKKLKQQFEKSRRNRYKVARLFMNMMPKQVAWMIADWQEQFEFAMNRKHCLIEVCIQAPLRRRTVAIPEIQYYLNVFHGIPESMYQVIAKKSLRNTQYTLFNWMYDDLMTVMILSKLECICPQLEIQDEQLNVSIYNEAIIVSQRYAEYVIVLVDFHNKKIKRDATLYLQVYECQDEPRLYYSVHFLTIKQLYLGI